MNSKKILNTLYSREILLKIGGGCVRGTAYLLLDLLMHLEVGHGVDVGDPVLIGHIDALPTGHQLVAYYLPH